MWLTLTAICGIAASTPAIGPPPAIADVKRSIELLNKAFEKSDPAAIKQWMTSGHIAVTPYYGGPRTQDQQLETLSELKLTTYKAGEMKFTMLTDSVVLVRYPLTLKGTFKGKAVSTKNYATAVWVKNASKWQEASYQETALRK